MHLLLVTTNMLLPFWSVATIFLLLLAPRVVVQGKKVKYTYKYNSSHVNTGADWWTEGCRDWNHLSLRTNDGSSKLFGRPDVVDAPPEIHLLVTYYSDCQDDGHAKQTLFGYDSQNDFSEVHIVHGVSNATVSFQSKEVGVVLRDCIYNDVYSEYDCEMYDFLTLPLSFVHHAITAGGSYTYRDKTVESDFRLVRKSNTVNTCKDVASATFDVTLGGEGWNMEHQYMAGGQLCQFQSGFYEVYTNA